MRVLHLAAGYDPGLGIAIALLVGTLNAITSQVLRKQGDVPGERSAFQMMTGWSRFLFGCSFLLLFKVHPIFEFHYGSCFFIFLAVLSGLLYAWNNVGAYYGIMMGPVAIAWTIVWLAAPAIGLLWAIFPGNERWTTGQFLGIGLFLVCLPTMGLSTYRHNRRRGDARPVQKYFFPVVLAGLFLGIVAGYFNKMANDYDPALSGSPAAFLVLATFGSMVGINLFHVVRGNKRVYNKSNVSYGALVGFLVALQTVLMAYGIRLVEVSRFMPTVASTAIIFSTTFSAFLHKEVPSLLTVFGIVISIGAIVLFAIG